MHHPLIPLISLISFFGLISPALSTEFTAEVESDVHYKRQIPIYLQHDLGDISIQGWNQDLIRVKLKKTATAESETAAAEIFKKFELVSLETPSAIELRIGTPLGTDLLTKLRNRQNRKNIRVDLEIKAPIALALTLVAGQERKIRLSQWRGKVDITGKQSPVEMSKVRSNQALNLNCPDCLIGISDSEFSGSIISGNQGVELKKTTSMSKPILIFSQNGNVSLSQTQGEIQVRTQNGNISSAVHQGDLHLQSEQGKIALDDLDGELDAQTASGDIRMNARKIGKSVELKSKSGAFELILPRDYSGEFDLQSIQGEAKTDFNIQVDRKNEKEEYGPDIKGKLAGRVGTGGRSSIIAFTESGSIVVKRKSVTP